MELSVHTHTFICKRLGISRVISRAPNCASRDIYIRPLDFGQQIKTRQGFSNIVDNQSATPPIEEEQGLKRDVAVQVYKTPADRISSRTVGPLAILPPTQQTDRPQI